MADKWMSKILCGLFLLLFSTGIVAAAEATGPAVLILNSYGRDFPWTDAQTAGFMDTCHENGLEFIYYVEYMDWKNNFTAQDLDNETAVMTLRYTNKPVDLVYATDDAAFKFALAHQADIFANAPIVFSGVYKETAVPLMAGRQNVTGVYEHMDVAGTVRVMLSGDAELRTVYVLNDFTESGLSAQNIIAAAIREVYPFLEVRVLEGHDYQEISTMLGSLPDHSAVLLTTYTKDPAGNVRDDYVQLFSAASRVPVYVLYEYYLNSGAVGGSLLSGKTQGEYAARQAAKLLAGNPTAPVEDTGGRQILDYQAIEHFALPDMIMVGSYRIINKPVSYYERHKNVIMVSSGVFVLMAVCIILLMKTNRRRQQAEKILRSNNAELASLYEQVYSSEELMHKQNKELLAIRESLQRSQESYWLAVDGVDDGLWEWEFAKSEITFSARCWQLLKLDRSIPRAGNLISEKRFINLFLRPEDEALVYKAINCHLTGQTDYYSLEFQTKQGEWVSIRGKALVDRFGCPVRAAGSIANITVRKEAEKQVEYLAYHDYLTRLLNRTAISAVLRQLLKDCEADGSQGALLFLDFDNFKLINDAFGHSYGDELLQQAALRMQHMAADITVGRLGGDEFIVLVPPILARCEAHRYAQAALEVFKVPFRIGDHLFHVSASIGIAVFPDDGRTVDDIFKNADLAMYTAKNSGKNAAVFYDDTMGDKARQNMMKEKRLRSALLNNELQLYYQPQMDCRSGRVIGFEALLRWQLPEGRVIMPHDFIGVAEESGLIIPIGRNIIRQACLFINKLRDNSCQAVRITVNISVVQLLQADFVDFVQQTISQYDVDTACLGFEITESFLLEYSDDNINKLRTLGKMGITIYLDDFGTGYSSLKYLEMLPIQVVKIDKSFIDSMATGQGIAAIIIRLVQQLGFRTIAEGVETEQQLAMLIDYGCDAAQGYLFSRPLPEDEAITFLQKR